MNHPHTPIRSAPELAYSGEVWRKLLHLVALIIPVGYYFVARPVGIGIVASCFVVSLLIDISRFRDWPIQRTWQRVVSPIVRPKESDNFTGATHILLSGWLCPLLFTRPAAAFAMTTIILGDIAAALIGRRWGRHRYAGNRSWEGSAAFFGGGLIAAFAIPSVPLSIGIPVALLAAVVEGLSRRVDDNLTVPLVAGLAVHVALRALPL
ncbi:MAG: diacylglycerol/polyprenol kinase family protein [Candidatus Zixiibacteriota bacterium]